MDALKYIIFSLAVHGLILFLCRISPHPASPAKISVAQKIYVGTMKLVKPRTKKMVVRTKRSLHAGPRTKTKSTMMPYNQFLPRSGELVFHAAENFASETAPGAEAELSAMSDLTGLAKELTERIYVPLALKEDTVSATAYLTLRKRADQWHVHDLSGNSYFRVLLYDAAQEIISQQSLAYLLSTLPKPLRKMVVRFEFFSISTAGVTEFKKPWKYRINGAEIILTYEYPKLDVKWGLVMPNPAMQVVPNLFGVGKFIYDTAIKKDKDEDPEVRALMRSPFFSKPFK